MGNFIKRINMSFGIKGASILGLIFITFLAAIQYVFLANVPESVSAYSFVFITNVIGIAVLLIFRFKDVFKIKKSTVWKGAFFAILLTVFNLFVLFGSRGLDSVVVSSIVSLYFIFVTPILMLLKKKVQFFSGVASLMAIIALLLMFGGNVEAMLGSANVIYLVIADICFAVYVVSVANLGENEDSTALTFTQMAFAAGISLVSWVIEVAMGKATFSIPAEPSFWVSAIFLGVFIRAIYGLLQISCQKHVPELTASLIFSTEIVITMIMDPILSAVLGTHHTPATGYQVFGAVLLIFATLMVEDMITKKMGYDDIDRPSVMKKIAKNTLLFAMGTLVFSMIISLTSVYFIQDTAVEQSSALGEDAAAISIDAMTKELENNITMQITDKAELAQQKLRAYSMSIDYAADNATNIYAHPEDFPEREVQWARAENADKWAMQRYLENESTRYSDVKTECSELGNLESIFESMIKANPEVVTIYLGTESGLMISYDKFSQLALGEENRYFEYKDTEWYGLGKASAGKGAGFTSTYWDSYGRGLTITCVEAFFNEDGRFAGCIAMDILMSDMNASMVNDGIEDPNSATMIDTSGDIIASKMIDDTTQETFNIFESDKDVILKEVGKEVIERGNGLLRTDAGGDETYVAFGTVESTGWIICIMSPVSTIMAPANDIFNTINENTNSVAGSVLNAAFDIIQNLFVLSAVLLVVITLSAARLSSSITRPLQKLMDDVHEISGGNLDARTDVESDDEIGDLAHAFNDMTDSLQEYIANYKTVTAEKERIGAELNVATRIQADMLPSIFPAFPDRKDLDIYASMDPAKEVGGDFYDLFMVDDNHLAVVIADVSGKGVPAALFMVIAKTLIKNHMQNHETVEDTLMNTNNQLSEGNDEMLFVTAWVGLIDLTTGDMEYADAGHEFPFIMHQGGTVEEIHPTTKRPPLAAMEDMIYARDHAKLSHTDRLFIYTDGVPEATNANGELFGMERLSEVLSAHTDSSPQEVLVAVRKSVDEFVGDAPQFDDLTMLCFEWI